MAGVAYYNTGTATVAVNSKTVTGTGTNWLSVVGGLTAIKAGDKFGIHVGRPIIIASVDSNTQLTLEDNWPGPAQTNAAYKIELTSPDVIAVEAMRRMLGSLSSGVLYGLSQLPSTPSKALTIDENGSAALADLSPLGKSLIAALNSSAAYGALGVIPNAQLPTRLQSFATRVSDWNSATEFGVYFGDGSTANTPASPFAFIGLVTPYTSAYFVQRLIAFGNVGTANNIEYVRECSNGTFSAWGRVRSTEAELDARYNVRSQTITNSQLPGTQTGKKFTTFTEIAGPAFAAGGDYARIAPSDFGAGKPALYVSHPANVLQWNIGLWDGATTAGTINFSVGALTHNSQTIWTAANDGAGSGLDADLLDGQQGAYYRDLSNAVGMLSSTKVTGIREVLTGSRTYYVRVGGSNSNTGLVNTDAGAFATLQYAYDFIATKLDLKGFDVTISLADGYHTTGLNASIGLTGGNVIYIRGNVTTPGNCFLEVTNSHCILNTVRNLKINVGGLRLSTLTAGTCLWASGGNIELGASCLFAPAANGDHFLATDGGNIVITADYSVAGGCVNHWHAYGQGQITCQNRTITISAAVSMTRWAGIATALLTSTGCTFTGKANVSGATYLVHRNGVVIVEGAGTSYFPGNSAGTVQTGGQYV